MATSGVVVSQPTAAMRSGQIATGATLSGKYVIGRVVGSGGVGIVFEATNTDIDNRVALKCLRPELLRDAGMVTRFSREAKAAAAIKSEYAASVYDVGTSPDGVPFMVMEFLEGKDLSTLIAEQGRLEVRKAVECMLQTCEALAIAHSKGIVHRDIKPENLFLTERAGGLTIVKVVDFGISRLALSDGSSVESLGGSDMGSPLYMAPELIRAARTVDVRSDIWSLGMVLYEALTGRPGFASTSIPELCVAILQNEPAPVESLRPDVPPGLVAVIKRCLEKDMTKRYQNVAELAIALMHFGPSRGRLNAERALSALQASGHVAADVTFPSVAPANLKDSTVTGPLPKVPTLPKIDVSQPSNPHNATVRIVRQEQEKEKEKKPIVLYVAIAVALISTTIAVIFAANARRPTAPPSEPSSSTARP